MSSHFTLRNFTTGLSNRHAIGNKFPSCLALGKTPIHHSQIKTLVLTRTRRGLEDRKKEADSVGIELLVHK